MKFPHGVSVIIPTYNRARLLPQALDSVLAQTYGDFEIIIVDDGSNDDTRTVIEPYLGRSNARYFYQDNQKQAAARNLGIKKAEGEYIAFLDSDDMWAPRKLEFQVKMLENHEEMGMVYSNQLTFRDDPSQGTIKYGPGVLKSGQIYRDLLLRRFYCSTPTILVRKSVIDEVGGFDDSLGNALEDWEFALRISRRYLIWAIDEPLFYRRLHADSPPDYFEIRIRNHARILERHLADPSLDDSFKRTVMRKAYFAWGNASFRARKYKEAGCYFSRAFSYGHKAAVPAMGLCRLRGTGRSVYFALYRGLKGPKANDSSGL